MPYGWEYATLIALQAVTVALVRDPGRLRRMPRHPLIGLLPLVAIGGGVLALGTWPGAVDAVTALAAVAVPLLALLALLHVRRWAIPLAAASPLLWLAAWRLPLGPWADLAGDLLIVLAAASLGRMTGWIAPRWSLVVGILVATAVDVWQVLDVQTQPVAAALAAAAPPRGLPALQQLEMAGASMGWGDAYLAALAGAVVAASLRATVVATVVTALAGAALGLLFGVLDYLPATVPVAAGILAAGVVERRAVGDRVRAAARWRGGSRMPSPQGGPTRDGDDDAQAR